LRSLGRQSIDGRMWRALASFGIASLLGAGVLGLAQWFVGSIISIFTSFSVWWQPGILGALLSLAGIVGLALLHRVVTVAIIGAGANEAELTERAQVSARQREGAVRAADVERTRIERDLHDGVQPRLVSVAMTLGLAQQQIDTDPDSAKALIAEAHTSTKAAITELRQLARGIYASVLDDRGLDAALSALAARSHIPVQLDVRLQQRCGRDAEAAVYFAIAESLTNAAKHSRASECRVVVRVREDGMLWARVEDNGIGGARVTPGGGLDGVMNRVLAAGGSTRLDSPQGGPTALEVSVPCAS
jgi:signal transduction histidine kinase